MKKFKKLFKIQLKWVPILAIVVIIVGSILNEVDENSYKELSQEEFTRIAVDNEITHFNTLEGKFRMELPSGEKYYHIFKSYSDEDAFMSLITRKFETNGISYMGPFYYGFILLVLTGVLVIFSLNVLLLWFVALYDLFKSEFKEMQNKWIWFFGFILLPFITPVFYLFIAETQKRVE